MDARRRLLYVEDDVRHPYDSDPILYALSKAGYEYVVAETGEDAVKRLQEMAFDCVILDIKVPNSRAEGFHGVSEWATGFVILKRLNEDHFPLNRNARVIITTGIPNAGDAQRLEVDWKAVPNLIKPFSPDRLVDLVRQQVENRLSSGG